MTFPHFAFLNKLSSRLIATFVLVVLLSMLGLGLTVWTAGRAILYDKAFDDLQTVSATKTADIEKWIDERSRDVDFLATNPLNQPYFSKIHASNNDNIQQEKAHFTLQESLLSMKYTYPFYERIDVVDANGNIRLSTDQTPTAQISNRLNHSTFLNTIRTPGKTHVRDMYIDPADDKIYIQFSRALYALESSAYTGPYTTTNSIIGLVTLTVDVEESFFPILEDYQLLGDTGEILLGRNEGAETLMLNNLRFSEEATALVKRIAHVQEDIKPLKLAALGESGTVEMQDHYQNQTLIAYNALPIMDWGLMVKTDRAEVLAPLWPLLRWLSIASFLLLAGTTFMAFRLWRRISQPIRYLGRAIDSVAGGDLAVDVHIVNNDEMGRLAESFRDMLESLRQRRIDLHYATRAVEITEQENTQLVMQLRQLNTDLEHIVHDRTEELSFANNKLKQLDGLKSKFISNVSHELRNPVASLKLYVNLLNKNNDDNRERYLSAIGRQIDILTHLVENILDISHLETDGTKIILAPCDVKHIAQRVIESNRPRAEDAGLELTLLLCPEPVTVLASASKLMQLVTNLVANAINYTEEGAVSVEISVIGSDALIIVEDTGIGIPKEDMPHLFERFYRGHNVNELEIRGTGLGLGIVKEVVDLHMGKIIVESEEGQGTRFQISIPLSTDSYLLEEQVVVDNVVDDNIVDDNQEKESVF